jgi:hypothetical protein
MSRPFGPFLGMEVAMTCRNFSVALLTIVSLSVPPEASTAQAATGPPCAPRKEVVAFLRQTVGERLVGGGLSSEGFLFEVYADYTGAWTIIATAPTGTSCLVAQGQAWEVPDERSS